MGLAIDVDFPINPKNHKVGVEFSPTQMAIWRLVGDGDREFELDLETVNRN